MVPQTDCLAWHALSKHDLALGTQGPPRSTTRDIESHFVQPRAHTRVQPLSLHSTNIKSDHARSARFNTPDPPSKGPTLSTAELFDVRGRPTARLYNEQGSDPEIAAIRAYLEDGAVPLDPRLNKRVTRNGHQFTVRQGIVCRYVTIETPLWIAELVVVPMVPRSMIEEVLWTSHCSPLAGHLGFSKTRERIPGPTGYKTAKASSPVP
ncbi:hypothetical protein AeNC1_014454 [Aphanomyces euteiches]|nr:hypothetical protein AeNC1_014454 [Aphanomyces euteiches]